MKAKILLYLIAGLLLVLLAVQAGLDMPRLVLLACLIGLVVGVTLAIDDHDHRNTPPGSLQNQ